MPTCEHFIYTAAQTPKKKGYQVIKQSKGITEKITSQLTDYLYPIGIKPNEFKESRSLLILDEKRIAYSIVKNIGTGYDGRDNTLYNHTFIIYTSDFQKLDYDTRIFEKYFIDKSVIPQELEPITIEKITIYHNYSILETFGLVPLRQFLQELFNRRKIAIIKSEQVGLIPEILAILPIELRLISFSTLIVDPERQDKYNLIQISRLHKYKLNRSFANIDVQELSKATKHKANTNYEEVIAHLTNLILHRTEKRLKNLFDDFSHIKNQDYRNKIILVGNYDLFKESKDKRKKEKHALECFRVAEELGEEVAEKYYVKTQDYLKQIYAEEYVSKLNQKQLIKKLGNEPLDVQKISNMLNELEYNTPKTRIELLNELVKKRKIEFSSKGGNLLIDAAFTYAYYNEDILRVFIENKILYRSIHEVLTDKRKLNRKEKQNLFERLIKLSLRISPEFIDELIKYPIFDLLDSNESLSWKWLIEYIYQSYEFRELPFVIVLSISQRIRMKIQKELKQKKVESAIKSESFDIKNIVKVIQIIMLNYYKMKENQRNEMTTKLEIQLEREITNLSKIIKKCYEIEMKILKKKVPKNYKKDVSTQEIIDWFLK